jgi:DNA-binding PadR family transcriptional regulator
VSSALEDRIRGEFLEMPGLQLTPQQASRLWAVDHATSERVLDRLTSNGFLSKTREGAYLRTSLG